jgi:hypothetical protein
LNPVPGSVFEFLFKYRPLLFREGRLALGAPVRPLLILLVAGLVVAIAVWTYRRAAGRASPRDRLLLALLRAGALAVLAFALLRPVLVVSNVVPQQNWVGVLVDDSRSMRIADGGAQSRAALASEALAADAALRKGLEDRFRVRYFRFSSNAERIASPDSLPFDGSRTRVAPALDRARQELSSVPLAGLVVLTDGADNAAEGLTETLLSLKAAQMPVYAVGLGRERFQHDIELSRVAGPASVLKGASLVVDLVVSQVGYRGRTVQVVVEDEGRIVGSEDVEFGGDGEPVPVRVHFTAESAGPRRFRFRVPPQADEQVLENNERDVLITVEGESEKILYFEGEPRHEVAFTRRAVEGDEQLQLVVLQRTAENKYLRLMVDSGAELADGFPRTREELFRYRGLVLGTVEAGYFSIDQLRMVADFVSDRGGGLLLLGGRHSLAEGGFAGTPLADALPVELDPAQAGDTTVFEWLKAEPTRAGLANPIIQIAGNETASEARWDSLPEVSTANMLGALKPGATELLVGRGARAIDGFPLLAFHRYGRGKAMVLGAQDTWQWQMSMPLADMSHETFWRQLLRWLVSGVPDQVNVTVPQDGAAPGEPVSIAADVGDEAYLRVNSSRVVATVVAPSGASIAVPLEWTIDEDGEYRATWVPTETGMHTVTVRSTRAGDTLFSRPASFDVAESRSEFFGASMNRPLLERIAGETGGRFYTAADLATLPEDLSVTGRGATVIEEKDLWDMPVVLLLLLAFVSAEWLYRRRKGLA